MTQNPLEVPGLRAVLVRRLAPRDVVAAVQGPFSSRVGHALLPRGQTSEVIRKDRR